MIEINKEKLARYAAHFAPGFEAAALATGTIDGDTLRIAPQAMADLRKAYSKPRGLGDVAAKVFQPIARGIDAIAKTDIENCSGCARRRAEWNAAIPDVLHPLK